MATPLPIALPKKKGLTTAEIRRRIRALTKCASEAGLSVAGIRMTQDGEISVVDISGFVASSPTDETSKYL